MKRSPHEMLRSGLRLIVWSCAIAWVLLSIALLCVKVSGAETIVVRSGSMSPAFDAGDAILVRKNTEPIVVGHVYTFIAPIDGQPIVTHRVVARGGTPGTWLTQGDANSARDPWVLESRDLQLRQLGQIPKLGWVISAVTSSEGRRAVLIVPLAVGAGVLLWETSAVGISLIRIRRCRTTPNRPNMLNKNGAS